MAASRRRVPARLNNHTALSSCRARLWSPSGILGNLLEMRAYDPGLAQILRISELGYHGKPLITIGRGDAVIVFRQTRVRAIRNGVLARVFRPHVGCNNLHIT